MLAAVMPFPAPESTLLVMKMYLGDEDMALLACGGSTWPLYPSCAPKSIRQQVMLFGQPRSLGVGTELPVETGRAGS